MAYKIRYGSRKYEKEYGKDLLLKQSIVSGALLAMTLLVRLIGQEESGVLAILGGDPATMTELAAAALADELASGAAIREGLVVWCRMIIYGKSI